MNRTAKLVVVAGIVASILVPATAAAASGPNFTALTLENGWTGGAFGTAQPAVALVSNVVTFRGALSGGTSPVLFQLPAADTPVTNVFVPVDLCEAHNGRLIIQPSGQVQVQEQDNVFAEAQCFVSLDGVSFTLPEKGSKPLTLLNGWTNAPFGTSNAAVRVVGGVVRLQGAVAGGTDNVIATLPKADWPKYFVYVPLELCNSAHGWLQVDPQGGVWVFATGPFSDAACFTSLDGASYVKADAKASVKSVVLQNGWQSVSPQRPAGLHASGKIVRLEGSVLGGTGSVLFTLPAKDRPAADVYIPTVTGSSTSVDGGGGNARLIVSHVTGEVSVQTESGNFSDAQYFTSFEGAWFAQ